MNLEVGQYISFGQTDFLVCDIKDVNSTRYVLLYKEKTDEIMIYSMTKGESGKWKFTKVKNKDLFDNLILTFGNYKEIIKGDKNEG